MKIPFQKIHALIQNGRVFEARHELKKNREAILEREWAQPFANLARRAELPELGARILFPLVRGEKGTRSVTENEKVEYAACLIKLGAVQEGMALLEEIDTFQHPESLLFLAYGAVKEWDYGRAASCYEKYLKFPHRTQFQRDTVKINLAAAYLQTEQIAQAEKLLAGASLLPKTFLPLRRLVALQNTSPSTGFSSEMTALKIEALENGQFELLRHCDLVEAVVTENDVLAEKLFFGTPFSAFRARLKAHFPTVVSPTHYAWDLHGQNAISPVIDLLGKFSPGSVSSQLLSALMTDFYRPFSVGRLAESLFPQDFYDPFHTPNRIQQIVSRLRKGLKHSGYPVWVEEQNGCYSLDSGQNVRLLVHLKPQRTSWEFVLKTLGGRFFLPFEAKEAANYLRCSSDTVVLHLNRAIQLGRCERLGKGRATKYRLLQANAERAA